jgi:hypothetical protein
VTDDPVSPPDPVPSPSALPASLARLLAEAGGPVHRVVFAGGVEVEGDGTGQWTLPAAFPGAPDPALEALRALGLAPTARGAEDGPGRRLAGAVSLDPEALAARHALRPILLATPGGASGDVLHLATTAGTLAWRPPVDRLADAPALALHARRLRFAIDALEHHLARAAERYADATLAARRAALLFGTRELTALAGHTAAYLELDAALAAALRVYRGTAALMWAAFGPLARRGVDVLPPPRPRRFDVTLLRARAVPPDLRETLLASWAAHGAPARVARGLLADAAAAVAHAPVRVASLEPDVWVASIPIPDPCLPAPGEHERAGARTPPRPRVDALERTWAICTEALRAATLAVYAVL